MEIRSIILGRVSTEDQKTTPEQIDEIRPEAQRRGEHIVEELEDKHKVSTKESDIDVWKYINKIPKIKYLVDKAKQQNESGVIYFNKLWVWKWDRLSRDTAFLELMVRILKTYGVECESLKEGTHPLTRRMMGTVAQEETDVKRVRVPLGQKREFAKLKVMNRPPFGFKKPKRSAKFIEIPEQIEQYKKIINYFLHEKSLYKTAKQFNFSIPRLKGMLQNRTYLGEIGYKGEWIRGRHDSIISLEKFKNIQEILNNKIIRRPKYLTSQPSS